MPMDNLPCRLFKSNLSIKIFETIAVDDIVSAAPIIKAEGNCNPKKIPHTITAKRVINTCVPPKPNNMFLIEFSLGKLNSKPIVNIKNTMPNSTKCRLDSEPGRIAKACGPRASPTTKYAIIGGRDKYLKSATKKTELTSNKIIN
jgi:hypothetical protein